MAATNSAANSARPRPRRAADRKRRRPATGAACRPAKGKPGDGAEARSPRSAPASRRRVTTTRDRGERDRRRARDRASAFAPCPTPPAPPPRRRRASARAAAPAATGPSQRRARRTRRAVSTRADGMVKPNQAARPPERPPPRKSPSENPTWLMSGPGRNWQSATRSPKPASSIQLRALDEFVAEIAEMGDRAAERGQPQPEEDGEHLSGRATRALSSLIRVVVEGRAQACAPVASRPRSAPPRY